MRVLNKLLFLLFLFFINVFIFTHCSRINRTFVYKETPGQNDSIVIHEGILSTEAQRILYKRNSDKIQAIIYLSEPVLVAQADREEQWGFFQFPVIGISDDGTLVTWWEMMEDTPVAYGKDSGRQCTPMMSKDNGLSWVPQDRKYRTYYNFYSIRLDNTDFLQVLTPESKTIKSFGVFPEPVAQKGKKSYYKVDQLPKELQGVYLWHRTSEMSEVIHAELKDPDLLRYAVDGVLPVVWWGDIKKLADNSLVIGAYPCYYLDKDGMIMPSGVSFYQSFDQGSSWELIGKVPTLPWKTFDNLKGDGGFTEPTFEVLADGTFICVMRTGSTSPMYRSFSYDHGKTWTTPEAFTPNGVRPQLLLLKNGILALVSGRPGMQIRFSLDGTGTSWTEPIDMIPFMNEDGSYTWDVSCGYPSILETDDNSFYIVYSNFTTKNNDGEVRKSIWFRKITVSLKR